MLKVVLFARLKREAGLEQLSLPLPVPPTVRAVAAQLEAQYSLNLRGCMVAVNEVYADPDAAVQDGDEVAFLPPVAGGSDDAPTEFVQVTDRELRLERASDFLVRPAYGAQAYFVGTVRSPNLGKVVDFIEYEGYAPMAERVMRDAAAQARARHGEELGVYVQHRTGRLTPGEVSILIGVGSPHRRAALEACDFLIEHLKVVLPVWKLEGDEDGEHWVKGQTSSGTL